VYGSVKSNRKEKWKRRSECWVDNSYNARKESVVRRRRQDFETAQGRKGVEKVGHHRTTHGN
jgi:hypothetical protein